MRFVVRDSAALLYPALVVLLAVFAIAPLAYPGPFQTHSGLVPTYNLMDLHAHLGANLGWAPTFGQGYDLFRMDGPLPYTFAEFFHLLGFSFLNAIKLVYALAFAVSGLGMFVLARRLFSNNEAGLLAATVYVYFPYHLAVVYVRGAFAEAVTWAIFPFALVALLNLQTDTIQPRRDYWPSVIVFAVLASTQLGLAIFFALFAWIWLFVLAPQFRSRVVVPVLMGLGLGVALLLPAILQNNAAIRADAFTPAFVYPFQYLTATWGSALPKGNYLDQFPFQIGIGAVGLTIVALALLFRQEGITPREYSPRRLVIFLVIASALMLLLTTPYAAALWEWTKASALLQYPFQLLTLTGLALSLVAASIMTTEVRLRQTHWVTALVAIPIIAVYAYLAPEFFDFAPEQPATAVFNQNELALVDAKIVRPSSTLRHGATVELDLQWQALRQVNHDYTVFVHVVDESGKTWGGQDSKPQQGKLPTTRWVPGRVISDTHTVQIDLAGPPEGYHLEVGLYAAATGERALTVSGTDGIRIEENQQ